MNTVEPWTHHHRQPTSFFGICSRILLATLFAAALGACNGSSNDDSGDHTDGDDQNGDGDQVDDNNEVDDDSDDTTSPGVMLFKSPAPGGTGNELWISDGTAEGTRVLKDINYAGGDSEPGPFTAVGDTIFFAATTDADGRELWKTDGTEAGTLLVKDIHPGPGGSEPRNLTALDGELYFTADDGSTGRELWKSDGTATGTVQVKNINPGNEDSTPTELTVFDGALYFAAYDGTENQYSQPLQALWKTDGTEAGTQKLKDLKLSVGIPGRVMVVFKGALYFTAAEGFSATEIWKTDGSVDGTVQVTKIVDETESSSNPIGLTVFNDKLYFQAKRRETGAELWKTDGTEDGTVVVTNINPCDRCSAGSSSDSLPRDLTPLGAYLYFTATNPEHGRELWKTDGTPGAEQLVKDIREGEQGAISSVNTHMTIFDNELYFTADNGDTGRELWKTDGTEAGTRLVKNINDRTATSQPNELTVFNNHLYFVANNGSRREWHKSDGTEAGTEQITDINFFSFNPEHTFVTP
ncbi:MAG: hypothetical protein LAT65_20450 [Saccharospirillum sp.]|nr:hypothetical protein [Saccharospirillum sp.]